MTLQKTISKTSLYSLLISVLLCVATSCSSDDENSDSIEQTNLSTILTDYLNQNQSEDSSGLSVLIKHQGNVLYQNNMGLARTQGDHQVNQHTGFRIASVTKPFTAIGIMLLVEQNLVSLDNKLLDVLPELPSSFENIKISHLLTHRSGLLDYIDDNDDLTTLDGLTISQVPLIIPNSGLSNLVFEPGTEGGYSNTNYVFLAMVIEKISGMSYPDFIKANIFDPANMSNSFVISENDHLGDLNNNYALSFGNSIKVLGFDSLIYGANGIVSSTYDLNLFVDALLNYSIISEESLNLITQVQGSLEEVDYGYGWMTGTGNYPHTGIYNSPNDFWHTGGFDGYRSVLSINPDLDLQVILLTNNGSIGYQKILDVFRLTREFIIDN
ncbi:serine hydrolase domain-containing protein [Muriicola sp. Z0-33]|uniref:serine hydrolase domain-containing protein n=1 Tax=Muriicola sp. Z0-33 TaxID=2816957 RepID=UPI0022372C2B|nr:serine hydrolase domain-containing protein [Muriicola sp. Z0-33]MCW5518122.1 beta-lactamase family protein [Muriicola sp. Z0-33]